MADSPANNYKTLKGVTVTLSGVTGTPLILNQISSIQPPGVNVGKIDVTHFNSEGPGKDYISEDFGDQDDVTVESYFDGDIPELDFKTCVIEFASLKKKWTFNIAGKVGYKPGSMSPNAKATATFTISPSGKVAVSTLA